MKLSLPVSFTMILAWIIPVSSLLQPSTRASSRFGPRIFNKLSIAPFSGYRYCSNVGKFGYELKSSRSNDKHQQSMPPKQFGKRKVAIVCGYVGSNFKGLQIDSSDNAFRTVEGEMIKALTASGFVSESNAVDLAKIGWSRSSRTDKGVHASRIVLSMKLVIDSNFDQMIHSQQYADRINQYLEEDIRVFSVTKVNQGFRAREAGSWREYEYVLPLSVINGKLEEFNRLLGKYEGSKSFHNFHRVQRKHLLGTRGRQMSEAVLEDNKVESVVDDSNEEQEEEIAIKNARKQNRIERRAQGLINSVFEDWEAIDRFRGPVTRKNIYACRVVDVVNIKGVDMIKIKVKGQSFLLHQIRLMLGAAIMVCTNRMPEAALNAALETPYFVGFPMAPSNGLILRNAGFGMNCNKVDLAMTGDDAKEGQIDQFLLLKDQEERSDQFLLQKIYDRVQMEWTENDMELLKEWLQYNAERYKVDGELKCKFEKLAADGKAEYESRLESLRRKDLNNTRVKIENGLDRIEFVSKLFSHKMMLPQNIATEVSVKLNTVPTMMLTKALRYLAVEVIEGNLAQGITTVEILAVLKDMHTVRNYAAKYDQMYDEVMSSIKKENMEKTDYKERKK